MDKVKTLGQIFTPQHVVTQILDELNYSGPTTLTSCLLEPSFGEGIFLYEAIKRIVTEADKQHKTVNEINQIINTNIWGIEYDETCYQQTLTNLKKWASNTYGLNLTLPHLYNQNALTFTHQTTFDYVVGNPPYIRIHNMDNQLRESVKQYEHSHGLADLYVIFIELGLNWLTPTGKLGYITPNSWLTNKSQHKLRSELATEKKLLKIINHSGKKIFANADTYTAILIAGNNPTPTFTYEHDTNHQQFIRQIPYTDLPSNGAMWNFASEEDTKFLQNINKRKTSIADLYNVQNGLCTLGNKYFFVEETLAHERNFETQYLKPAVKGSTYKGITQNRVGIFPYQKIEGKYVGIREEQFKHEAPNIYQYLIENRTVLEARTIDKGALWFWYGRSQAIQITDEPKLIIPTMFPASSNQYPMNIVPAGTLMYAGLLITQKHPNHTLEQLKTILQSEDFAKYVKLTGQDKSGDYKTLGSPQIKTYRFEPV